MLMNLTCLENISNEVTTLFFSGPTVVINPGIGVYPINYVIRVSKPTASPDGNTYTWKVNYWQMDQTGTWSKN